MTGEKIILKRISSLRNNILPALTFSSLYFLLRVYTYALEINVPYVLRTVYCRLHVGEKSLYTDQYATII